MAASLVTKFMDYIEELDDFGDIFGVSDSNTQAIDAAKRITDAFENEGDFKEGSKYMQNADKYIKPLYNACVACPSENPVNIWKAIRSANDSQLNQLNNILDTNAGQDAISKWVSIGNKPPIKDDRKNPIDDTLTGTDPNQEALRRLAHNDSEEKAEPAKTTASKSPATMSNVLELSGLDELPADDSGNLANIQTVEDDDEVEFPKTDEEKAAQKAAIQAERQAKKEQEEKAKQERAATKAAEKEAKAAQKEEQQKLKEAEKAKKEAERLAKKEAEAKAKADKEAAKKAENERKAAEAAAQKAQKEAAKAAQKQAAAQKVTNQTKTQVAAATAKTVAPTIQPKPAETIDQERFAQIAAALDNQLNIEIPNDDQAESGSIPDETAVGQQSGEPAEQAADSENTEQQQQQPQPQQQQSATISIPAQPSEQETDDAIDDVNQVPQKPTDAATIKPAEQSAEPAVTPVEKPVRPTVVHTPARPVRTKPTVEPTTAATPSAEEPEDETPETGNPRDDFSDLYDEIDNLSISSEQAEEAKRYADVVFGNPNAYPREYAVLSGNASKTRTRCVEAMLATANKRLGYKEPVSGKKKDTLDFQSGVVSQSKGRTRVGASLVMPSGFGLKKNAAIWNTPVITDFGYPFLNFSSEAMLSVIKSKKDDEELKNHNLKKMFKDAAKRYGGVWKAIYSSPLTLLRQIATDVGIKCTPKYLKIDGSDLINSDSGENVTVIPIKYYSVDPEFEGFINVPRDFLTSFYDVIDYSSTSKRMYLKYAQGMSEEEFAEEITENRGVPPFYILVPKQAKFSKCHIRSGSLLGSLMNLILGRKKCTMVKTVFQGKRGCLAMETDTANTLYADI